MSNLHLKRLKLKRRKRRKKRKKTSDSFELVCLKSDSGDDERENFKKKSVSCCWNRSTMSQQFVLPAKMRQQIKAASSVLSLITICLFPLLLLIQSGHLIEASSLTDFDGATFYKAPVGSRIRIGCNASHWSDDSISLILWFKGNPSQSANSQPIYTIDARQRPLSSGSARHLIADSFKGRAKFVIPQLSSANNSTTVISTQHNNQSNSAAATTTTTTPANLIPYLDLFPLEASDQAEYRCRVDYRSRPRENFLMILFVLVPPSSVEIMDSKGRSLEQIYGPLNEGSDLTLLCLARGGRPAPAITWKQNGRVIDETYLTLNDFFALKLTGQMLSGGGSAVAAAAAASSNSSLASAEKLHQLRLLDNFFSRPDSPASSSAANDDELPSGNNGNDNNLTATRSLLDSINEEAQLQQRQKPDSSNGQQQQQQQRAPSSSLMDSLWRDWSSWPEFEHFQSALHNQQRDSSLFAVGNETNKPPPPPTSRHHHHRNQQQHHNHPKRQNKNSNNNQPSALHDGADENVASLLELQVDESIVTSINYLRLIKLNRATLFSAANEADEGDFRPRRHHATNNMDGSSSSSSFRTTTDNLLAAAKLECEASNLHYDLRSLIRIFAPPTLMVADDSNDVQQQQQANNNKRQQPLPSLEPASSRQSSSSSDSQLVWAIERALEVNLRQPQPQPQQLDHPTTTADQQQQQQSISMPSSYQLKLADEQQPTATTVATTRDGLARPDGGQSSSDSSQLLSQWPAVLYQQLIRPHQLSSNSKVSNKNNKQQNRRDGGQEFVQTRLISLDARLRPLDVHLTGPQRALLANQLAEFSCTSTGSLPAAKLTWLKDGQQLSTFTMVNSTLGSNSSSRFTIHQTMNGSTSDALSLNSSANLVSTSRLTLKLDRADHNKRLGCRAENEFLSEEHPEWTLEDSIVLNVQYQPILKLELGNKMLSESTREGNDIYFVCHVDAQPPIRELTWLHNEKPINETSSAKSARNGQLIISNNSLVLQRVQMEQRGQYACLASNSEGLSASNRIELRVLHAPTCVGPILQESERDDENTMDEFGSLDGREDEHDSSSSSPLHLGTRFLPLKSEFKFRCQMSAESGAANNEDDGDESVEFTWYLNNTLNERRVLATMPADRRKGDADREQSSKSADRNSVAESQLELKFESTKDFGQLYCLAKNSIGQQKRACVYSIEQLDETQRLVCLPLNVTADSVWIGCDQQPFMMSRDESNPAQRRLFKFHVLVVANSNINLQLQDGLAEFSQPNNQRRRNSLISDSLDEPLFELVNLQPDTEYSIQISALNSFNGLRLNGLGQSRVRFKTVQTAQRTDTENDLASSKKGRPIIRRLSGGPYNNTDLISAAARPQANQLKSAASNKLLLLLAAQQRTTNTTQNASIWSTIWNRITALNAAAEQLPTTTAANNNKQRYLSTLVGQRLVQPQSSSNNKLWDLASQSTTTTSLLVACLCSILLITLVGFLLINRTCRAWFFSGGGSKVQQQQRKKKQQVATTRLQSGGGHGDDDPDVSSLGSSSGSGNEKPACKSKAKIVPSPPSCSTTTATHSGDSSATTTTTTVCNNNNNKRPSRDNNSNYFHHSTNCGSSSYSSCSPPISTSDQQQQQDKLQFQSMLAPPSSLVKKTLAKTRMPKTSNEGQNTDEQLIDSVRLLPFENRELNNNGRRLSVLAANSPLVGGGCMTNFDISSSAATTSSRASPIRPLSQFDSLPVRRGGGRCSGQQQLLDCFDLTESTAQAKQITFANNNNNNTGSLKQTQFGEDTFRRNINDKQRDLSAATELLLYGNNMQMMSNDNQQQQHHHCQQPPGLVANLNSQQQPNMFFATTAAAASNVTRSRSSVCFDSLLASSGEQQQPRFAHSNGRHSNAASGEGGSMVELLGAGQKVGGARGAQQQQRTTCLISDANSAVVLATARGENDDLRLHHHHRRAQQQQQTSSGELTCNGTLAATTPGPPFDWPYNMHLSDGDQQRRHLINQDSGQAILNGDDDGQQQIANWILASSGSFSAAAAADGGPTNLLAISDSQTHNLRDNGGYSNGPMFKFAHSNHQKQHSKCSSSLLTASDTDSSDPTTTTASNNNHHFGQIDDAPLQRTRMMVMQSLCNGDNGGMVQPISFDCSNMKQLDQNCLDLSLFDADRKIIYNSNELMPADHHHHRIQEQLLATATAASSSLGSPPSIKDQVDRLSPQSNTTLSQNDSTTLELINCPRQPNESNHNCVEFVDTPNCLQQSNGQPHDNQLSQQKKSQRKLTSILKKNTPSSTNRQLTSAFEQQELGDEQQRQNLCQCSVDNESATNL